MVFHWCFKSTKTNKFQNGDPPSISVICFLLKRNRKTSGGTNTWQTHKETASQNTNRRCIVRLSTWGWWRKGTTDQKNTSNILRAILNWLSLKDKQCQQHSQSTQNQSLFSQYAQVALVLVPVLVEVTLVRLLVWLVELVVTVLLVLVRLVVEVLVKVVSLQFGSWRPLLNVFW